MIVVLVFVLFGFTAALYIHICNGCFRYFVFVVGVVIVGTLLIDAMMLMSCNSSITDVIYVAKSREVPYRKTPKTLPSNETHYIIFESELIA